MFIKHAAHHHENVPLQTITAGNLWCDCVLSFHRGGFRHQTANKQKEGSQAIITFAFRQYLLLFKGSSTGGGCDRIVFFPQSNADLELRG